MTKTFTALDMNGNLILKSRGKTGAAQKAIGALLDYRASVKAASGMLYGHPWTLGRIEIDGVRVDEAGGLYADDLAR